MAGQRSRAPGPPGAGQSMPIREGVDPTLPSTQHPINVGNTSYATRGRTATRGLDIMGFSAQRTRSQFASSQNPVQLPPDTAGPAERVVDQDVEYNDSSHATLVPVRPSTPTPRLASTSASSIPAPTHRNSFVVCATLLIAFLHTKHHVSFRACAIILAALNVIFLAVPGNILGGETLPLTLTTIFARLNLKDEFRVHPICYRCHKIFDPDISSDTVCSDCENNVFRPQTRTLFRRVFESDENPVHVVNPGIGAAHVVAPIQLLSTCLEQLFTRPGMVSAVNVWKTRDRVPDELKSMQDSKVWRTIKGPDNESFFFGGQCNDEIRLGVTFSLDWFGRKTSSYGPSHSSGAMSFCIQNLENRLKYRAENLNLHGMTPGPTEPTSEQLQHYLKLTVNDLIMLYDDGITVRPPEHPNGIRVRVALVGIIADHPALCKLCGFADHSHNEAPCTKCHVSRREMFSEKALRNEYDPRDGEKHRELCFQYHELSTDAEREDFFAKHGVRWTEFARLKYFDIVRFTVVDPMHNLLLGIAKTQWYTQWIKTNTLRADTKRKDRELHLIHNFLETFEAPLWAGRLPLRVGEPAGGSLTADEYKFAVTGPWAMIIPMVWDTFIKDTEKSYESALKKYHLEKAAWDEDVRRRARTRGRGINTDSQAEEPIPPSPRMRRGEDLNFLLFAQALKILVGSSIRIDKVPTARSLLEQYLLGFSRLYGAEQMKPNHHWAVHIPDQILDFGPVYTFWAFLTERLNKILKNLNSNNWTGGRLEVSMMREFQRKAGFDGVIENMLSQSDLPQLERSVIQILTGDVQSREALGTVEDAARDEQSSTRVEAGSIAQSAQRLSDGICRALEHYYNKIQLQVHQPLTHNPPPNTSPLKVHAVTYNFALLDGRRITPTSRSKRNSAGSSIIQARVGNRRCAGEVQTIFVHKQPGVQEANGTLLVAVNWMKRSQYTPLENPKFIWDDYPELGVETWELDQYVDPLSDDPPMIMPLAEIHCQLCRGRATHVNPQLWITTTMDRFPTTLNAYGFADVTEDSVI